MKTLLLASALLLFLITAPVAAASGSLKSALQLRREVHAMVKVETSAFALAGKGPPPPCDSVDAGVSCTDIPACNKPWNTPAGDGTGDGDYSVQNTIATAAGALAQGVLWALLAAAPEGGAVIAGFVGGFGGTLMALLFPTSGPSQNCPTQSSDCLWEQIKDAAMGYTDFAVMEADVSELQNKALGVGEEFNKTLRELFANCPDCATLNTTVFNTVNVGMDSSGQLANTTAIPDLNCSCSLSSVQNLANELQDLNEMCNLLLPSFLNDKDPLQSSVYLSMFATLHLAVQTTYFGLVSSNTSINRGAYDGLVDNANQYNSYVTKVAPTVVAARLAVVDPNAVITEPADCVTTIFQSCPEPASASFSDNFEFCKTSETWVVGCDELRGGAGGTVSNSYSTCPNAVNNVNTCAHWYRDQIHATTVEYLTKTLTDPAKQWTLMVNAIPAPVGVDAANVVFTMPTYPAAN